MKEELKKYLKANLIIENKHFLGAKCKMAALPKMCEDTCYEMSTSNINDYLNQKEQYNDFQTTLFKFIDKKGLKDSDVYNKVNIDRRLFSKIRSDSNYHPSKETVILLGVSLELNEKEFEELLESASYSLPKNNYFDLIIRFCIINRIFRLTDINELLDEYQCKLLNY